MSEQPALAFGVRELATQLEMPPSSVSRLLARLAEEQLVKQDPKTGQYSLSLELARLGILVAQKQDLRAIARPHMESLAQICHETVILGMYDSGRREMLNLEKIESAHPLTYTVVMNSWFEIYQGGSGLAILAFLPPWEQDPILRLADSQASESEPWLFHDALSEELARIRERGYAMTHSRRLRGAISISAPIFSIERQVIGDMIVTVPEIRWTDHSESDLALNVTATAGAITEELGGQRPDSALGGG